MINGIGIFVGYRFAGGGSPPPPSTFATTQWQLITSPQWQLITDTWT
jgi:hypothetical protein